MGLTDVGLGLGKELIGAGRELGDYIRAQRTAAQISLRSLADRAGVSNPYLSQVERGLRKPSAAILTQIADGLSISAETLLVKAGFLHPREPGSGVIDAIRADAVLTDRFKATLVDIYRAFANESRRAGRGEAPAAAGRDAPAAAERDGRPGGGAEGSGNEDGTDRDDTNRDDTNRDDTNRDDDEREAAS